MGEVRRVRDRELNRTLATKVLKPALLHQPALAARFSQEAHVCAQLQHPGIVPVHDFGRDLDGRIWFTAAGLADELEAWLDGARLRELELVQSLSTVAWALASVASPKSSADAITVRIFVCLLAHPAWRRRQQPVEPDSRAR